MSIVDGAARSQKNGVESSRGVLKNGAEVFVLFLRSAQLVLRSSVLTVLELDEVDVMLENAEIFGSVLSGEGGFALAAGGGAAEVLPSSLSFPLPLLGTHPSKRRSKTSLRWKSQRALRKGSQLVLTLARAPPETRKKEKQQRKMRIRRVVSHAFRPAPSPPEASRSTSNPPIRSPIITVVVKVYFVSWLCNLVQAFDCMAVQFSN